MTSIHDERITKYLQIPRKYSSMNFQFHHPIKITLPPFTNDICKCILFGENPYLDSLKCVASGSIKGNAASVHCGFGAENVTSHCLGLFYWYLYAPFRLNELSMNLALQPLASQTPTKISQSRSICLVCLLCFVKFNHIINIVDFYNYITDICKSFRYTSNLITDILNKKLRIFLDISRYF